MAFILWCLCFSLTLLLGICCFFSKKPVGFFANAKTFPVKDVKGYNRACGFLWGFYSLVGILAGLPLLEAQNDTLVLLSVLGVMGVTLALILIYVLIIEKKYRAKHS